MTQEITKSEQQWVDYARTVTEQIKDAVDSLWQLLDQMQSEELWRHLGYESWKAYVEAEFDFGVRRSYQLLHHGKLLKELQARTNVHGGDEIHISEEESRGIDPNADVPEQMRQRLKDGKAAKQAAEPRDHEHKFVCSICNITTAQAAKDKTLFTDEARSGRGTE